MRARRDRTSSTTPTRTGSCDRWRAPPIAYEGAGPDPGATPNWATDGLLQFVLARHRYMDDALARALRGKVEQVVLLGAGYEWGLRFAKALRGGRSSR